MATSIVTRGKTEVYVKNEQTMPLGWALDRNGKETQDAVEVNYVLKNKLSGGLLPLGGFLDTFGGHKGYGLALMVEIFTRIFAGSDTSNSGEIILHKKEMKTCSCFIAIDYGMFGNKSEMEDRLSRYLQQIRDSEKAEGYSRIYTHGEKEVEARQDRLKNGIPVDEVTLVEIQKICKELEIDGPVEGYSVKIS